MVEHAVRLRDVHLPRRKRTRRRHEQRRCLLVRVSASPDAQKNLTLEFSRRARGIPVWAALRSLGKAEVAEMVQRHCSLARRIADGLSEAGYTILTRVVINQVLECVSDDGETKAVLKTAQESEDQTFIWLNPTVDVAVAPSSSAWHFDTSVQAEIQSVYVGDLKNPGQIAPGVKQLLAKYGMTEADFQDLLRRDPFSNPAYRPDPDHFLPIGFNFPYAPPYTSSDPVTTLKYDLSTVSVASTSHDATDD